MTSLWSRGAELLWQLVRPSWLIALGAFGVNLAAAIFEGSTIGILAVAVHVVGGAPATPPGSSLAFVGGWLKLAGDAIGPTSLFLNLVLLAILTQVLRSGFQFAGEALTAHLQVRVHTEAHRRIFTRIMRMPFPRVSAYRLGDLTDYLNQTGHLSGLLSRLNLLVRSVFFVVIYGVLLFWLSWPLTLLVLVAYGIVSRLFQHIMGAVRRFADRYTKVTVALSERTTEFLGALRLIHSFARQEATIEAVDRLNRDGMGSRRRAMIWSASVEPITDMLTMLGIGAFLAGGYLVLAPRGLITLPTLAAFLLALYRVAPRLRSIYSSQAALVALAPNAARIIEILGEEQDVRTRVRGRASDRFRDAIVFGQVTHRYQPDEPPAVVDLSLTIPRGRFIALVGSSGAGKSTIVDLLLGLYAPTSGRILVDGRDLGGFDPVSWRGRLGVVSQDPFLFHASIRENIAYGEPSATPEKIRAAARAAHADEFITRLAQGDETVVGERGYRLSGGQRQRIALARALVREPDLLILDEATSSLDSESERHIQLALDEQRGVRTVVAIAHRLSTVARADHLLVLAEGRLVEQGTHHELLARQGLYARLWRLQSESEGQPGPADAGSDEGSESTLARPVPHHP